MQTIQNEKRVVFGATVTVLDGDENTRIYKIVGIDETDPHNGKVSWTSPIGKALLQAHEGDVVDVVTPRGQDEWEILKIEYKSIE